MARGKAVSLARKIRTKQFSSRLNVSVGLLHGASFVNFCTLGRISWQNFTHDHDKIEPRVTEPCKENRETLEQRKTIHLPGAIVDTVYFSLRQLTRHAFSSSDRVETKTA